MFPFPSPLSLLKFPDFNLNEEKRKEGNFNFKISIAWRPLIRNTCWLHTRARKYNLSALGLYFECEGVKRIYLNFS